MTNPDTANDPLQNIATGKDIDQLYQKNLINEGARLKAKLLIDGAPNWLKWSTLLCLTLGVALTLAGIIYFFAYNWADLSKWAKFVLIQTGIIVSLIAASYISLDKLLGKILVLSAAVMVGVFMAVFGQIYQTGADAFDLFLYWSILILPWVLLANFLPLWLVWLVIVNTAFALWCDQWLDLGNKNEIILPASHAFLNVLALAAYEFARQKQLDGFTKLWPRQLIAITVIFFLMITICMWITRKHGYTLLPLSSVSFAFLAQALLFYLARWRWPDFTILAGLVIAIAIEIEFFIMHDIIFKTKETIATFFLAGIVTIAIFSLCILYLRRTHQQMEARYANH